MPAGRPTKYKKGFGETMVEWFKKYDKGGRFPTFSRFVTTDKCPVTRETLRVWAYEDDDKPEFSDAYKLCKEIQEANLTEKALSNDYNATFAWRTAKNVLGWRDERHLDMTSKGEKIENSTEISVFSDKAASIRDRYEKELREENE